MVKLKVLLCADCVCGGSRNITGYRHLQECSLIGGISSIYWTGSVGWLVSMRDDGWLVVVVVGGG